MRYCLLGACTFFLHWALLSTFPAYAQQSQGICIMDADGANLRLAARVESYTRHGVPRWSPDGHDILFEVSWKTSGEYEPRVFKVSAAGGAPIDMGLGKMPSWSPDGKQIVFRIPPNVGENRAGVWIMNADGSGREYLFPGHQPLFSPEGTRIVYTNEEQNSVFVYDVLESKHRKIDQPYSRIIGYAAWSKDGKQLCFIGRSDSGQTALATTASDGSQDVPNVYWWNQALVRFPIWGPSEQILLTLRTSGQNDQIYTFNPAIDTEPKLLEHQPAGRNFDASWSPELKKIVFVGEAN